MTVQTEQSLDTLGLSGQRSSRLAWLPTLVNKILGFGLRTGRPKESSHDVLVAECEKLANIPHDKIHQLASSLAHMIVQYYEDVRQQAQRSFSWALIAAGTGLAVFMFAIIYGMRTGNNTVYLGAVAGGLIEVIAGINFYLYLQTARQFAAFHTCLERTNRFLMANAMCEHLGERKDEMRAELIRTIANAPLLTQNLLQKGE